MPLKVLRDRLMAADAGGGGLVADVKGLDRVVWHEPEDLTVKVESGVRLADLQARLAGRRQWLPLDPGDPEATIKRVIDENLHGPRRYGFGTVREHLIGMEVLLADGRLVTSGGNVVKNVAGYDFMKLLVGARQSLGVVVTATFKLWPLPRREVCVHRECESSAEAEAITSRLLDSPVCPIVLDWHGERSVRVVTAFAGEAADVDWQLQHASVMGFTTTSGLEYDAKFFRTHGEALGCRSVLPSRLRESVDALHGAPFLARAGNGTIWSPAVEPVARRGSGGLEQGLKDLLDPRGILPPMP